jgi:hypothetical protein
MSLTRDRNQEPVVEVNRLYKDLWLSCILPKLEVKDLLNFGAASKETRQAAFTVLFKQPAFKAKIDQAILRSTTQANARLTYRDGARWGATRLPYVLRISQFVILLSTLYFLEIAYHTYASGYPSPEQVDAAIKSWRASPRYGSEFDSPPIEAMIAHFPNDGYRTLSLVMLVMVVISFICRDLFLRTNSEAIDNARHEQNERSADAIKAARLTYLRDQLPRELIATHSLFAKVVCSNSDENAYSLNCNVL